MREPSPGTLKMLREPATIRARCAAVTRAVDEGRSAWFQLDRSRLADAADRVARCTRARYPDLRVPPHGRWRQFGAGGVDRKAELDALLGARSAADQARARVDLTVVSVLLDASAGAPWRYREREGADAPAYARSEGLAVASLRAFAAGAFSDSDSDPLRADAAALHRVDAAALRRVFKAGPNNPLVGLEGRAGLLSRLGHVLAVLSGRDGFEPRAGALYDRLTAGGSRTEVDAAEMLRVLLVALAPVWASGQQIGGQPAGDVWPHRWAGSATGTAAGEHAVSAGWVPLHHLSQWLAYSLVEPLQWAGVRVTGLQALTGLPEYRNGGLLIDCGVIVPRAPHDLARPWRAAEEPVVEWRALTVSLLDELAPLVRERLGLDAAQLPLGAMLEGGSVAAGGEIAAEKRPDGGPPLVVDSDGTVL